MGLNALYVLGSDALEATYGPEERGRIATLVNVMAPPQTAESAPGLPVDLLARTEVLISGWRGPTLDARWLERLPNLMAVFYGGGALSNLMTREAWQRGLVVSSAYEANAVPVAEYTVAMIILSLKSAWRLATEMRTRRSLPRCQEVRGCFERVVGLVSLGAVGRAVATHLAALSVSVLAYDPHVTQEEAAALGVTLVSLEHLMRTSDAISVHTPHLPATENMIDGAHLAMMKPGATFINTARGAVVREDELIAVAERRGDLQFVLDVTRHIPPESDSPLYTLPNVLLTPHIAGSQGHECRRMGRWVARELERYVTGVPLQSRITFDGALNTSHRWL